MTINPIDRPCASLVAACVRHSGYSLKTRYRALESSSPEACVAPKLSMGKAAWTKPGANSGSKSPNAISASDRQTTHLNTTRWRASLHGRATRAKYSFPRRFLREHASRGIRAGFGRIALAVGPDPGYALAGPEQLGLQQWLASRGSTG